MLPAPRVIVIDDDPKHLKGLADGLNRLGAACLQIEFNGDPASVKACPHVRVIFADLHLNEGAVGGDHQRHFGVIGGLIEEAISPTGPYLVVLWTKFANQADALGTFLGERLTGVPKPFAVKSLDKMVHLSADGTVKDPVALVAAIAEVVKGQPQIGALLDWEERVLGAAADTIGAILGLSHEDTEVALSQRLARLLYHLAEGAVGEGHVEGDRFRAVNEALLPILADRVGSLRQSGSEDPWRQAFSSDDMRSALDLDDAARLNRFSHIADCVPDGGDDRGAVINLLPAFATSFKATFDIEEGEAARDQFACKDFVAGNSRFRWLLVQCQASCDHAQRQPGPLPYLLALEMPCASLQKSHPQALWVSPPCRIDESTRVLVASARFAISLPRQAARTGRAVYRLREQMLGELMYKTHSYGARPGTIAFRQKKAKPLPATAA